MIWWYTGTRVHMLCHTPKPVIFIDFMVHNYTGTHAISYSQACNFIDFMVHNYTSTHAMLYFQGCHFHSFYGTQVHWYTSYVILPSLWFSLIFMEHKSAGTYVMLYSQAYDFHWFLKSLSTLKLDFQRFLKIQNDKPIKK